MKTHTTIDPVEATAKAVDALLTAIDGAPAAGAVTAYKAAIRRHGVNIVASVGPSALAAVLDRIKTEAPDASAARHRTSTVSLAWEGLEA